MIKINFVVGSCLFWVYWRGSLWCWPCLRSPQWWRSGEGWAVLPGTYPLDYLRSQQWWRFGRDWAVWPGKCTYPLDYLLLPFWWWWQSGGDWVLLRGICTYPLDCLRSLWWWQDREDWVVLPGKCTYSLHFTYSHHSGDCTEVNAPIR